MVWLHTTKKPLSVSIQPPKTGLLSSSKGTCWPERESGPVESAHPFHRLRTNTYYCLSWFVCMCICVCVCMWYIFLSPSLSSVPICIRAIIKLNEVNCLQKLWDDLLTASACIDHTHRTAQASSFHPNNPYTKTAYGNLTPPNIRRIYFRPWTSNP